MEDATGENKILIVDDDKTVLELIRDRFDAEHKIDTAMSGEEGLDLLKRKGPYAIVISDIFMDGMDGVEFLSQVCEYEPDTVRMVMTANPDPEVIINSINEGHVFRLIKKPIDMKMLESVLKDGFQQHGMTIVEKIINKRLRDEIKKRKEVEEKLTRTYEDLKETNRNLEKAERIYHMDLDMAASVQANFFPSEAPVTNNFDVAYLFRPMSGVSGDIYDFFVDQKTNDLIGAGIFDVSGHGIASGLLTLIAKSIIYRNFIGNKDKKLEDVLNKINKELRREIGHIDNYITGILLRFEEDRVEYVNSAHPDLLIKRGRTGKVERVVDEKGMSISGLFLGIDLMDDKFKSLEIGLESGDSLFLYSDCLNESRNNNGSAFDANGIIKALEESPDGQAQAMLDSIMNRFYEFTGHKEEFDDDLTVILIKRK